MVKYKLSVNLSGSDFDPDLFISRFKKDNDNLNVRFKNKASDMRPFGTDAERGKIAYGYGSLTLCDIDVLGKEIENEREIEDFLNLIAPFFDFLEVYGVEDVRLTLSVEYGQQCNFRLSRYLLTSLANLGQGISLSIYQNEKLAESEKETIPSMQTIAKELEIDVNTFLHVIKPHMLNSKLYEE